jgi:polysaccharide biosynthesis/export protein
MQRILLNLILTLALCVMSSLSAQAVMAQPTGNYVLRPMDIVEVKVFQETDLTGRRMIEQDGSILLPLIGKIQVGGLTQSQAATKISTVLKDGWLVSPQVEVNVASFAKRKVYVRGQVVRPGAIEIKPGEQLDVVQAIAEAGDVTRLAQTSKILVKRGGQTFTVNLDELTKNPTAKPFLLTEGDVVYIAESLF